MRRLKLWLMERFFPAVAKEEIAALRRELEVLKAEYNLLEAYVDGLEAGTRVLRRVIINNNGVTK